MESPDSDYDVLDINGWDLRKTLIQFHKGNATLFEWANSLVVYKVTAEWNEIYEAAKPYFSEKVALYHYYGTANSTFQQYLQGDKVKYKKYVYALRPLLACKYMEEKHGIPPVRFADLLGQELPAELLEQMEMMLAIKGRSDEKDLNPVMPVIQKHIEDEIERYGQLAKTMEDDRTEDWTALDKVFLRILKKM